MWFLSCLHFTVPFPDPWAGLFACGRTSAPCAAQPLDRDPAGAGHIGRR
jgi:hypothetical protein